MKGKKVLLIVTVFLCFLLGSYGTAAYMNDSKQVLNRLQFIGDKGMDAILEEPSWKPENGLLTVPGMVMPKDPQVTNVSEADIDELVSLQCKFVYTSFHPDRTKAGKVLSIQDMKKVLAVYDIDYNSDILGKKDWVRFGKETSSDPVQHFYYSKTLKRNLPDAGDVTVPLFTKVSVIRTVNAKKQAEVKAMGGFEIQIAGQVIQQMDGEKEWGLASAENAYEAGLFKFTE